MGFRCSLCCLVKGFRPTWLSGKELPGGCVFSGTFKSAAKRQRQTPNGACICRSCMRDGQMERSSPKHPPVGPRGGCGTAFQLLRYSPNS